MIRLNKYSRSTPRRLGETSSYCAHGQKRISIEIFAASDSREYQIEIDADTLREMLELLERNE